MKCKFYNEETKKTIIAELHSFRYSSVDEDDFHIRVRVDDNIKEIMISHPIVETAIGNGCMTISIHGFRWVVYDRGCREWVKFTTTITDY